MLQHLPQVDHVEAAQAGGHIGVQEAFHYLQAQGAGMLGRLARWFHAQGGPAAAPAMGQEEARPGADVQDPPALRRQKTLEGFKKLTVAEVPPIQILAVALQVEGLLHGIVVLAVDLVQLRRGGQRRDMLEPAGGAVDDLVAVGLVHQRPPMVTPDDRLSHASSLPRPGGP